MFSRVIDNAKLELADSTMSLVDLGTIGMAAMAKKRYGDTPWGDDHTDTAAFYALAAYQGYKEMDSEGNVTLEVKPYRDQEGTNAMYTVLNWVFTAGALTRATAREEAADDKFCGVFTDLIPHRSDEEDEDEAEYIDTHARMGAYYPAWEAEDATFVTKDGCQMTVSEVAQMMCQILGTTDLGLMTDTILAWADKTQEYVNFELDEVEPEQCPLVATTVTNVKTGVQHTVLLDGRQPDYAVRTGGESDKPEYDLITQGWSSVRSRDWQTWRHSLDIATEATLSADADTARDAQRAVRMLNTASLPATASGDALFESKGYDEAGRIDTLVGADAEGLTFKQEILFEDAAANIAVLVKDRPWERVADCTIKVFDGEGFIDRHISGRNAWVLAWRRGMHECIEWRTDRRDGSSVMRDNTAVIAEAHGIRLTDDEGIALLVDVLPEALPVGYMHQLMETVDAGAAAVGRDAFINFIGNLDDEEAFMVLVRCAPEGQALNADGITDKPVRQLIVDAVLDSRMFPAQAVKLMAKLDGKHGKVADRFYDIVREKSAHNKALLQQKRVSSVCETLWAEAEYPCFGLELRQHIVGIVGVVGKDDVERVREYVAKYGDDAVVVGYDASAEKMARALELPFIGIPLAKTAKDGSHLSREHGWAQGQVASVSDALVIGRGCNQRAVMDTAKLFVQRATVLR